MSQIAKKRLTWAGLLGCVVLVLSGWLWVPVLLHSSQPAQAQVSGQNHSEAPPINAGVPKPVGDAVNALRSEMGLTSHDMAAMGLSKSDSVRVLQTLVAWYESNAESLRSATQAVKESQAALKSAWRQINIGPRNEQVIQSVPQLQSALEARIAQRQRLVNAAIESVQGVLSADQRVIWNAGRANADRVEVSLRYVPSLTDAQVRTIRTASHSGGGSGGESGGGADQSLDRVIGTTLNSIQKMAQLTAELNYRQHIESVLDAEFQVLAPPAAHSY